MFVFGSSLYHHDFYINVSGTLNAKAQLIKAENPNSAGICTNYNKSHLLLKQTTITNDARGLSPHINPYGLVIQK